MENVHRRNKSLNKNVVVDIVSGYGFGLIKGQIVIYATLMNIKYKTPGIPVNSNNIKIDSKVCWSLDNNILRNLKMSNACIRVECFNIPQSNTKSQEKLGYILLKIKEAQMINPTSNDRIENNSYKLIGSKNCSYNLTLSFRVEDYNDETIETTPKKKNLKLNNNENIVDDNNLENVEENTIYIEENSEIDLPKININNLYQDKNLLENKPQNTLNIDIQPKSNETMEEWKNKQIILFNEKMKTKKEQILKEFNNKLNNNKTNIEKELSQAMEKCKKLVENLDIMADTLKDREAVLQAKELENAQEMTKCENMIDILKEREAIIRAKELELVYQKNSMDNNVQIINELKNKNFELETKLNRAEQKNIFNEQLRNDINSNNNLQIQQLENTILNLRNNLEEANKLIMKYKERWIICVRKINQMK